MLQSFCITISLLGRRGGNNCYERVSSLVEPYKNMFSKIYPTLLPNTCGPKGPFFNMEGLKLLLSFGVERRWHCRIKIGLSHAPIHCAKKNRICTMGTGTPLNMTPFIPFRHFLRLFLNMQQPKVYRT